jgi:hypothetical protein
MLPSLCLGSLSVTVVSITYRIDLDHSLNFRSIHEAKCCNTVEIQEVTLANSKVEKAL